MFMVDNYEKFLKILNILPFYRYNAYILIQGGSYSWLKKE